MGFTSSVVLESSLSLLSLWWDLYYYRHSIVIIVKVTMMSIISIIHYRYQFYICINYWSLLLEYALRRSWCSYDDESRLITIENCDHTKELQCNKNNQIFKRTAFYQVTISRDREHWNKCFSKDVRALGMHNLYFQFRVINTHQWI